MAFFSEFVSINKKLEIALIKEWNFDFNYNYTSSFMDNYSDKGEIKIKDFLFEMEFTLLTANNSYFLQILTLHLDFGNSSISFGNAKGFLGFLSFVFNVMIINKK